MIHLPGIRFVRRFVIGWIAAWLCVAGWARPVAVEWFEAARMGDDASLQRQLAGGAEIDQVDFSKRTALHHALASGRAATARFLIERGASVSLESQGCFPLNYAVRRGDLEMVRLLLAKGANPQARGEDTMFTAVSDAIAWGRIEILRAFEAKGAVIARDRLPAALVWAARHGQAEVLRYLLEKGADVNAAHEGNLPLAIAAVQGEVACVEVLLKAGARVNAVSDGAMPADYWSPFPWTALAGAVLADEMAVVRRLLDAGADPKALDGAAMIWADLIGNPEVEAMLVKAGGRPAPAFAFAEWLDKERWWRPEQTVDQPRVSTGEATATELARIGAFRAPAVPASAAGVPAGTKVAIVALGEELGDMEALLVAKASSVNGAHLLERTEIRRLLAERKLSQMFGTPGGEREAGRLLGADLLVLLRRHRFEKTTVVESRIVAVRTGVVAGVAFTQEGMDKEEWAEEVAARCRAAGALLSADPRTVKLVAPPRVIASINTAEARELERRVSLMLAARLGRAPGVFLVERETLDRIAVERGGESDGYATSMWLMDAALQVPLGAGEPLTLSMTLHGGGENAPVRKATAVGARNDTAGLVEQVMSKVLAAMGASEPGSRWAMEDEAKAFFEKARLYAGLFMWAESTAAAEAASALGLANNEVSLLRLQGPVTRLSTVQRIAIPAKRTTEGYAGRSELVSFRAPLLMPWDDVRALRLGEMIDLANAALDVFEASLPKLGETFAGVPASLWLCGEIWDAASLPLRVAEPLSYRREHEAELSGLRERLRALHAQALAVARARRNALEVHSLTGIGMKHLAWWQPDESQFRAEVRRTLMQAAAWTAPLSEQPVWGAAHRLAKEQMGKFTGRAGNAWARLARELATSTDPREAFLGAALLAVDVNDPRKRYELTDSLRARTAELSDLDRGVHAKMYPIGFDSTGSFTPFVEHSMGCWYVDAFSYARGRNYFARQQRVGLPQDNAYFMTGGNNRVYPEIRAFYLALAKRRIEAVKRSGPGGLVFFNATVDNGYTKAELADMGERFAELLPAYQALADREPQAGRPIQELQMHLRMMKPVTTGVLDDEVVESGPPYFPVAERYAHLPSEHRTSFSTYLHTNGLGTGSNGWYLARAKSHWINGTHKVDETIAFRIGPNGAFREMRPLFSSFLPTDEGSLHLQPQVNDRWMAVIVHRKGPDGIVLSNKRELAVIDMRAPGAPARYFPLLGTWCGMLSVRVTGDRVIYTFIHNPTGPVSGSSSLAETAGDPTFGIAEIDLRTGKETVLASSRNQPPIHPVEREDLRVFREIYLIGDRAFTVANRKKRSRHAYDFTSRAWRPLTPEDEKEVEADIARRPADWGLVHDGVRYTLQLGLRKECLRFFNSKTGLVDVPVKLEFGGIEEAYRDWPSIVTSMGKPREGGVFQLIPTEHGLLVNWKNQTGVCWWLPMERVRAGLAAAVAAKRGAEPKRE